MPGKIGLVYFILACRGPRGGGPGAIKIGFTLGRPEARVSDLQVGSPMYLSLLETIRGRVDDEALLHQKFSEDRIRGEWFAVPPIKMWLWTRPRILPVGWSVEVPTEYADA